MTEKLGNAVQQVGNRRESKAVSKPSLELREFALAMAHLVALKRTVDLTEVQVKSWYAVLAGFPATVLNKAIIEVALTKERFPDVGDLYQVCRKSLPKQYAPHGTGHESDKLGAAEIASVAERLGLKI